MKWKPHLWYIIALIFLAILTGRFLPHPLTEASDNSIYYPLVELHRDASLFQDDLFLNTFADGGLHTIFLTLHAALPLDPATSAAIGALLLRIINVLGFYAVTVFLFKKRKWGLLAGIAALLTPGTAGSETVLYFVARSFVYAFYPWFLLVFLRDFKAHKYYWSIAFFILLVLIHPVAAFPLLLLFVSALLLSKQRIPIFIGLAVLTVLVLVAVWFLPSPFTLESLPIIKDTYGEVKGLFDFTRIVSPSLLIGIGLTILGLLTLKQKKFHKLQHMLFVWLGLLLLYYILGAIMVRVSPKYILLLSYRVFIFAVAFFPLGVAMIFKHLAKKRTQSLAFGAVLLIALLLVQLNAPLGKHAQKTFFLSDTYQKLCALETPLSGPLRCASENGPWDLTRKNALLDACAQLEPYDGQILAPPLGAATLRVCADKSVVVTGKDHGTGWFSSDVIIEWNARMEEITQAYDDGSDLTQLADKYDASIIIARSNREVEGFNWVEVYENEFYHVFVLDEPVFEII